MKLSRSQRIMILLAIDTVFFFVEIIVGYSVHSLALVADSFHMLNDVFSLLVALWAIKLAKTKSSSSYTYGWQRAEVLGALVNGVFLLALCLSIFLEAIQRFFEPQPIANPFLVLCVGSAGLASNIIGLFLFHDHGHSHGGHSHSHSHSHDIESSAVDDQMADDNGAIEDILPENYVRRASITERRFASPDTHIHVLPWANRQEVHNAAASDSSEHSHSHSEDDETTPLATGARHTRDDSRSWHHGHNHTKPKSTSHSSRNLNMHGVFLHVLGDALGNVGVILTALFVQYAPEHPTLRPFTHYADPFISLVITIIIFSSALPLCKSASKILLQGVPKGIALDEVKADIASIPGVASVHELHIWQLSDTKMIASLHITVAFDPKRGGGNEYMRLARAVRGCLHGFGVHSVTIQPEFGTKEQEHDGANGYGSINGQANGDQVQSCLLECSDECGSKKCCGTIDEADVGNGVHGHSH